MRQTPALPTSSFWKLLLILPLCLSVLFLSACETEDGESTAEEILEEPEDFYGKQVVLTGTIDQVFGPQLFTLGSDELGEDLLIMSADPVAIVAPRTAETPFMEDDTVQVTGTVHRFVVAEIEQEFGIDLDEGLFGGFEDRPVVVARSEGAVVEPIVVTPGSGVTPTVEPPITDLLVLVNAPDLTAFVGRKVTVEAVEVQDVVSDRGFWVGPEERRLFVLLNEVPTPDTPTEGRYDINKGQRWRVEGTLRSTPVPNENVSLSDTERQALSSEKVYLEANRAEGPIGS